MWVRRRIAAALVIAVIGSAAVAVPASAGGRPFTFNLTIGSACVTGLGLSNTLHEVLLYTADGRLKDRDRITTAGRAYEGCFFQPILGHDRLVIKAAGQSRAFRVPALMPVIDRVTDRVTGQGKPGSTVDLTLMHSEGFAPSQAYPRQVTVNANGRYAADFSDIDIVGADQVAASWTNGEDSVAASWWAPFITYGRVSSNVVGSARRGTDVRVSIVDAKGDVRGVANAGTAMVFHFFEGVFIDANGADVYPRRGDHVLAPFTGDADLLVPRMHLAPRPDLDRVAGSCMPNSAYQLWVFYGQIEPVIRIGVTDANGDFSRGVGIDLRRSHLMQLNCRYPSGDFVFLDQEV